MIGLINLKTSNVISLENALNYLGAKVQLVENQSDFNQCSKVILPGNGSFDAVVEEVETMGLKPAIVNSFGKTNTVLGICVGMQILFSKSTEGKLKGLDIIPGKVVQNPVDISNPNIGWYEVAGKQYKIQGEFYFMHSYHCQVENPEDIFLECTSPFNFTCAVRKANFIGVQFHPEKSGKNGLEFLKRFMTDDL